MKEYDHKKLEKKWQNGWEKNKIYQAQDSSKKKKYYSLIEFPYPSGDGLHVGHPRPYIGMDLVSRKKRMEGYNVLYPIGWDAFGLPTENYAIKTGLDPRIVTKKNTDNFRRQIQSIGISFDWSREINTTDPKYYKWTQWLFLQFLKKGLAYKAKININWCLSCKIGLANEEVVGGMCERCGGATEKREKEQWMLRITKYAERLDKDLDTVDYLPHIKLSQKNWIGRSEGALIKFPISNFQFPIEVFTTRADTIFGATYMVLAPEHKLVSSLKSQISNWQEVEEYVKKVKSKTEIERTATDKTKTGVELKGIKAINPANKEEIPIWIADYVLTTYGTGAVMAVPAHDERDFEFAKKYDLPIKNVVEPLFAKNEGEDAVRTDLPMVKREAVVCVVKHWAEDKYLCLKWKKVAWSGFVTGGVDEDDPVLAGKREILEETGYKNAKFIKTLGQNINVQFYHVLKKENRSAHFQGLYFELENGEQEDISLDEKDIHDIYWVNREQVEQFLSVSDMKLIWGRVHGNGESYTGGGILANSGEFSGMESEVAKKEIIKFVGGKEKTTFKLRDWIFSRQRYWGEPIPVVHCDKCGIVPLPEKDLPLILPKVKNYQPTDSGESPLANISKWVNVKCPKCKGKARRETDTMPNWAGSSWYFLRYADPKNSKVFADKKKLKYWTPVDWYNGGNEHTTLHLLYSRFWNKFLYDIGLIPTSEPYMKRTSHGLILAEGGEKMSKSRGNVINPDDIVNRYGADTLRLYEMFMGPFDQAIAWSEEAIIGPRRFLERAWRVSLDLSKVSSVSVSKLLHKTIKKVGEDIDGMHFNTAVSALMVLVNEMDKNEVAKEDYKKFLQILAPFAPHIAEELWNSLGEKQSIHKSKWPKWDEKLIVDKEVKIAVQINGKVRAEIVIKMDDSEENVKEIALKEEAISRNLEGKSIKKFIYIKNRLANFVV